MTIPRRWWASASHPDDVAQNMAALKHTFESESVYQAEKRYLRGGGDVVHVLLSVTPLRDSSGTVASFYAVVQDITDRVAAEVERAELAAALLAEVDEMIVLVDSDYRITYASPSTKRWLGYDPATVVGRDLRLSNHPEDEAELARALGQATTDGPAALRRRVRAANGSWRVLDSRVVRLDDAMAGSLLVVSRDVSEAIELKQQGERLELEGRVSQRLEAVGQLAAGIAHEINTPLQFVGDSVTFLKSAVDDLLALTGLYRATLFGPAAMPVEERRRRMREAEEDAEVDYLIDEIPRAFARTTDGISRVRTIVHAMKRFSHASATEVAPADLNEAI